MRVDALQQVGHARAQRGLGRALYRLALVLGQQRAQRRVDLVLLHPLPARADRDAPSIRTMLDVENMQTRCALGMSSACCIGHTPKSVRHTSMDILVIQQQKPRLTGTQL